jgi:hypothetical protein
MRSIRSDLFTPSILPPEIRTSLREDEVPYTIDHSLRPCASRANPWPFTSSALPVTLMISFGGEIQCFARESGVTISIPGPYERAQLGWPHAIQSHRWLVQSVCRMSVWGAFLTKGLSCCSLERFPKAPPNIAGQPHVARP